MLSLLLYEVNRHKVLIAIVSLVDMKVQNLLGGLYSFTDNFLLSNFTYRRVIKFGYVAYIEFAKAFHFLQYFRLLTKL